MNSNEKQMTTNELWDKVESLLDHESNKMNQNVDNETENVHQTSQVELQEQLYCEVKERMRREKNVVVLGIPESDEENFLENSFNELIDGQDVPFELERCRPLGNDKNQKMVSKPGSEVVRKPHTQRGANTLAKIQKSLEIELTAIVHRIVPISRIALVPSMENVGGFKGRIHTLLSSIISVSIEHDVIYIMESWLDNTVPDLQLFVPAYKFYRLHRDSVKTRKTRGGEIIVHVKQGISCRVISKISSASEIICLKLALDHRQFLLVVGYILPTTSCLQEEYISSFDELQNLMVESSDKHPNAEVLLCGDFNLPNLGKKIKMLSRQKGILQV
ncbi:hypothetical protein QAD02_007369 [Eretmocerus hayati]|uniref:Uncharacterized protein n=1 Tax=Eretmocerus hayati TaxID=131215 RepID=A0ACC2N3T7_9HYME|nr:hypothetical protein QAD02_007369 [Eretmocerus hayati]